MAKDAAPEDICPAQSLEPQSFYFLLIFRVYKGEFQTQDSDKVKSAPFVDFHVLNIRYRPKMKFEFLSVHFKQVLGHLSKSKVHAQSSRFKLLAK